MNTKNQNLGNLNALRLGLRSAQNLLLPGEAVEDFEALLRGYEEQLAPQTLAEQRVVARLVALRWKVHRVDASEESLLRSELERQLEKTSEKKTAELLRRALMLTQGLLAMLPSFAAVKPQEAEKTLLNGLQTAVAMVDAVAVKVDLPVGVLADMVAATDELRLAFVLDSAAGQGASDSDYIEALHVLQAAMARAEKALVEAMEAANKALEKKAEELRHKVRLNISTVRLLDRYRAGLERSVEREMEHLKKLIDLREHRKSFGGRMPTRLPPVELKVV